jgi:serine/threonine protein kinase
MKMTMGLGTPFFMAPELLSSESDELYSQSADVYAFAVFMYRLFTPNLELGDNRPTRSVQQMMMRIMRGLRLKKVPKSQTAIGH